MFLWHFGLQRTQCASKRMRTTGFEGWEPGNNQSSSVYPHTEHRPYNDLSDQGTSDTKTTLGVPPPKTLLRQVGWRELTLLAAKHHLLQACWLIHSTNSAKRLLFVLSFELLWWKRTSPCPCSQGLYIQAKENKQLKSQRRWGKSFTIKFRKKTKQGDLIR